MSNLSYKITEIQVGLHTVSSVIATTSEGKLLHIPIDNENSDYQRFLKDVKEQGYSIVEGPTVGVTTDYKEARKVEYPPLEEQLDKIYHSGVDAWKADIRSIKDKYPKSQVGVTTVAAVPSWVQTAADEKKASDQKSSYLSAVERLKQPRIKLGTPYLESVWDSSNNTYFDQTKYKDAPDPNDPDVVRDEAFRDEAQATIDATPQSIIDSINT